jgi:hypothetical protein
LTVDLHHVPVSFRIDRSTEHAGPEGALCGKIGSVEHDDWCVIITPASSQAGSAESSAAARPTL